MRETLARIAAGLGLVVALAGAPGCLVLSMDRWYDDRQLSFDERLIGTWTDADDHVTVELQRAPWRAYRIVFTHPTEKGVLTGYLFRRGSRTFLDLVPVSGVDPGSFLLPAHALLAVTMDSDTQATVAPLSFDWFDRAMRAHALPPALQAARGQHTQVVLGGGDGVARQWLMARLTNDLWGEAVTFKK